MVLDPSVHILSVGLEVVLVQARGAVHPERKKQAVAGQHFITLMIAINHVLIL